MVAALEIFYDNTGGAEEWEVDSGWLQGEPCVDGWHGVTCCPRDYPQYDQDGDGTWRCRREDGGVNGTLGAGPYGWDLPGGAAGCSSGTCVVVGLQLSSNGLKISSEPADAALAVLCTEPLRDLRRLDLSGNALGGPLPACVAQMRYAGLSGNSFRYDEGSPLIRGLVRSCRTGGMACSGVPPIGCSAFGASYEVRSDDSELCIACPDPMVTWLLAGGVLLVVVALAAGYYHLVQHFQKLGERLDLWVNTAAIFFCHLQTLSILGTLKLAWPQSVETLTSFATVDFLSLGAIRPECALQLGENAFYYLTIVRMAVLMALVLGVSVVQWTVKHCSPASSLQVTVRRVDFLEMFETVVFTLGLTLSWRITFDLWAQAGSRIAIANVGTAIATILFLVQLQMLAKYAINIRALITGKSWRNVGNLSHERLKVRLAFLIDRFRPAVPYWQYMVWLRQFLLTLDVWVANFIIDEKDDVKTGRVDCHPPPANSSSSSDVSVASDDDDDIVANATATNATADYCRSLSAGSMQAIWAQAAVAMVVFVAFWVLQARFQPYSFDFQNRIENGLFGVNLLVLFFGCLYTGLKVHGTTSLTVEVLLMLLLVLSLLGAAAFIVLKSRQAHLERRRKFAERMVAEQARARQKAGDASALPPRPPLGALRTFEDRRAASDETGQSPRDEPEQTPRKPERCTPFGGGKRRKPVCATEAGAEANGCFALTIAGDTDMDMDMDMDETDETDETDDRDDLRPVPRRRPMAALRFWRPAAGAPRGKADAGPAADGTLDHLHFSEPSDHSGGYKVSPSAPAAAAVVSKRPSDLSSQKSASSSSMCGARRSRTSAAGGALQPRRQQPQVTVDAVCRRSDRPYLQARSSDRLTNSTPMV